jgi:hypothetical protein
MREVLTVGTASASPASKARGFLKIASRADGTPIQMPVIIVNGEHDGPVVSVVAGIHGDEYESIVAAGKFAAQLRPEELHGAIIDVPVVNVPAFDAGTRESPIDHFNLNRIFPGKKDGFLSQRIAYTLTNEVIRRSQYFLDLHGGGDPLAIGPLASLEGEGEDAMALAKAWSIELIWKGDPVQGLTTTTAIENGVKASLAEIGGQSRFSEESVQTFLSGLRNVMMHVGALPGQPKLRKKYVLAEGDFISCASGGIYIAEKAVRDIVKEGTTVGRIYDAFEDEVETVTAPLDGIILSIRTYPKVSPGDWVACIGKTKEV